MKQFLSKDSTVSDDASNPAGYYGCGDVRNQSTGNFYLHDHPSLTWTETNAGYMNILKTPLTVTTGPGDIYRNYFVRNLRDLAHFTKVLCLQGRAIINGVTYYGKVHANFPGNVNGNS